MTDLKNLQDTRQLLVTWPVGYVPQAPLTMALNNVNYYVNLPDLYFQPNFVILRSVVISAPTAGRDDLTYRIRTSLSDQPLCNFVNGAFNVPQFPNTVISIRKPIQQISFSLEVLNVSNIGEATWQSPNPTLPFVISLLFDMVSVKDYRSDKVAVP
jgi:hypothetical protein